MRNGPRRRPVVAALIAIVIALASLAPALAQTPRPTGIDPADMDLAADPTQAFYRFANGGWLDRTEIPADQPAYGVFNELEDRTTDQLLDLLNDLAAGGTVRAGTDQAKAVDFFAQGTDLATRNTQGIEPIQPILDRIDRIGDVAGIHDFQQGAVFLYVSGLLPISGGAGLEDSSVNGAYLSGPYLGLPNRDYYLEDDDGNAAVREAYVAACARLLALAGYDETKAASAAQAVYDLERALAEPTLSREEQQDISLLNNPMTISELDQQYPLMDWTAYVDELGLAGRDRLVLTEPRYLPALADIVARTPLDALKDYYKLEVLWSFAPYLSEEIDGAAFSFVGPALLGVSEQEPLAERVLDQVNGTLGEAVGQLYVAEYFPPAAKQQITNLIESLRIAFGQRLAKNPWMSPETKATAQDKLAKLGLKVGYPDQWRGYEAVEIADSFAMSALSGFRADAERMFAQVGEPVDREEWFIPPQVVNAFYSPQSNEIVFPAAILQPPFFDYRADAASNFGAIGYVIGHEITHGFDLQGSQFDADGNLANWWTAEDHARFEALNEQAVAQYGAIEVLPGLFVDGQITVTENVADLGGTQVAYDALGVYLETNDQPLPAPASIAAVSGIARLTQEQRFFVAAAEVWRPRRSARSSYPRW